MSVPRKERQVISDDGDVVHQEYAGVTNDRYQQPVWVDVWRVSLDHLLADAALQVPKQLAWEVIQTANAAAQARKELGRRFDRATDEATSPMNHKG